MSYKYNPKTNHYEKPIYFSYDLKFYHDYRSFFEVIKEGDAFRCQEIEVKDGHFAQFFSLFHPTRLV